MAKRKSKLFKIILLLSIIFIILSIGVGIFFIILFVEPISVSILNNNGDDLSFSWGDTIDLHANINRGWKSLVKYRWELVPNQNSTLIMESIFIKDAGSNLKLQVDDLLYFEIKAFRVHASYLSDQLFVRSSDIQLYSYLLANETKFVERDHVQSWNPNTNVLQLNGSSFSDIKVGDIVLESEGLFLVSILNITSVNDHIYSYQTKNSSIPEAFIYLFLRETTLTLDQDNTTTNSTQLQINNQKLQKENTTTNSTILHNNNLQLLKNNSNEYRNGPPIDIGNHTFSFDALTGGSLRFLLDNSSYVQINCTTPLMSTFIQDRKLISQLYRMICKVNIDLSGKFNVPSNYEKKWTYYLYGSDDSGSESGGIFSKGKKFKFTLKGLRKKIPFILSLELKVPLVFDIKTKQKMSGSFTLKASSQFPVDYIYSPSDGLQMVPFSPVVWDTRGTHFSDYDLSCNSQIDISVGIGLEGTLFFQSLSGYLRYHYIFNTYDNQYNGSVHGLTLKEICDSGKRPETLVSTYSADLTIGLKFWIFGLSKTVEIEFGSTLLHSQCLRAPCTIPFIRYTCGNLVAPECQEASWGQYIGYSESVLTHKSIMSNNIQKVENNLQNIYDNNDFYNGYLSLHRSKNGDAPEFHYIEPMLPPLKDATVADLGCGFGFFSRYCVNQGAKSVVAVDLSEKMLARAKQLHQDNEQYNVIEWIRSDIGSIELATNHYQLVYSSLAIHYLEHLEPLFKRIYQALVSGGRFVFSTEHPIYSAPTDQSFKSDGNQTYWPVANYSIEGKRETNWFVNGVVKYHRTIGTLVNLLIETGFTLNKLEEFRPTEQQLKDLPDVFSIELQRPMFLMISVTKN
ncbi:hypothetical protein PPL_01822 [Heterostelium album PN500]|uniref:Methyltransferase type 11 domain-containing protein n=1 Tax=Heterostelium pallidum (strain ATCC 26659 / Pp 5 / PN500) TaxID=670386 RepID=D3B0K5_HETP5|nr:hypothetical protein PPL_01822 [Heterostelium album PN500]EFA84829.1 hypothetical protein PPL_01822 [Heterostelium album PN500]|eukprot:XP_020436940.1 hypothetical protein PPL_01822 [Heterostelium album PN500]